MEDNVIENESEANVEPVNEFACLSIADCQQVLERLKGGILIGELPYAAKTLLDEYKYDEDTLRREVSERLSVLESRRKKAVESHIAKKYIQALEEYDEYFGALGSQVSDYEAEQLRKECQQYVASAKKRKWQAIAAGVIILILCGIAVDQVFFRKNVKAFQAALQDRDYENATKVAIKISWRYDTEGGISNLICFLDEENRYSQLCGQEITRSSLDTYGGVKWQEVLKLVDQADANEDLSKGIQQLRQASEMTTRLLSDCVVLGEMERDFNDMYESCNQKDADHYAHENWEILQQLRETEVTQTNLNLISERYNLMVGITNQVARLMDAQKDMQPVKDVFDKRLKEEQIQVQGMLNYSSSQLNEAQRLAEIASKKEEAFQFADARLIYTRAIEHIKASQKERAEDSAALDKIEQAKRDFNRLYGELDVGSAQENCPDEWQALSVQIEKAKSEYGRKDRWNGGAYVCYEAALGNLKRLMRVMQEDVKASVAKEEFDSLYDKLDSGQAQKWFPSQWNALVDQKKKADAAYERGDKWEDVTASYRFASQKLDDLMREISTKAKNEFQIEYGKNGEDLEVLSGKNYQDALSRIQKLVKRAEEEYAKPRYWEGDAYNLYINATQKLKETVKIAVDNKDIIKFIMNTNKKADVPILEPSGTSTNEVSNP